MLVSFKKLFEENRHERTSWLYASLMRVMTEHTRDCREWKQAFNADIADQDMNLDVRVTINGTEVPFDTWIVALEECYNENLQITAKQIMSEHFNSLTETFFKVERELEWRLKDFVEKHEEKMLSAQQIRKEDGAISARWVLNQLAGLSFPQVGEAYDFIKKCLSTDPK